MLDVDGNEHVDKKEFLKVRPLRYQDFFYQQDVLILNITLVVSHVIMEKHIVQRFQLFKCLCAFKCENAATFNAASSTDAPPL